MSETLYVRSAAFSRAQLLEVKRLLQSLYSLRHISSPYIDMYIRDFDDAFHNITGIVTSCHDQTSMMSRQV